MPTTSDSNHRSKRAKVSQRSSAEGAGDSGLMEVAPAANAKQKPPECLTTVLLRERIARVAGQAQKDAQSSESVSPDAICLQALPEDAPPVVQDRRTGSRDIAVRIAADPGQVATALASLNALMYTPRSKLSKDGRRRFWVEMCEAARRQPFPVTPSVVTFGAAVLQAAGVQIGQVVPSGVREEGKVHLHSTGGRQANRTAVVFGSMVQNSCTCVSGHSFRRSGAKFLARTGSPTAGIQWLGRLESAAVFGYIGETAEENPDSHMDLGQCQVADGTYSSQNWATGGIRSGGCEASRRGQWASWWADALDEMNGKIRLLALPACYGAFFGFSRVVENGVCLVLG